VTRRLWILGAQDQEMDLIEELLTSIARGEKFVYATRLGKRVSQEESYLADPIQVGDDFDSVIWIECSPANGMWEHVIDHHRPGSKGYLAPPAHYLPASSVGQVCATLWRCRACGDPLNLLDTSGPNLAPVNSRIDSGSKLEVGCDDGRHEWPIALPGAELAMRIRYVAASDHCLAAAYCGWCPGVDPEGLMQFHCSA
jgi:hypothetical protein